MIREILEKIKVSEGTEPDLSGIKYTVVLLGGSIGEKPIRSVKELEGKEVINKKKIFNIPEEAKKYARQMNKYLSPGEKKYYGLKYVAAELKDGVFTGKKV